MFKSLHHVPVAAMDTAFAEIHRVLKPEGRVYLSEPVFAGNFNEILRLFHDESVVRQAAFDAIGRAVSTGSFQHVAEEFFLSRLQLKSFEQFEKGILNATHTEHRVTPELRQRIQDRFESYRGEGGYRFDNPIRVDVLQRGP